MGKERVVWPLGFLTALAYWLFLPSIAAQAATFRVNSLSDAVDANPGNSVCETAPGNGVCNLRATIEEANALREADQIILPSFPSPNAYVLTIVTERRIADHLAITGDGALTPIGSTVSGNSAIVGGVSGGSTTTDDEDLPDDCQTMC